MTNHQIASGIAAYVERKFMALSPGQISASADAWRSCQAADRPDNRFDAPQKVHKQSLARFAELCGGA